MTKFKNTNNNELLFDPNKQLEYLYEFKVDKINNNDEIKILNAENSIIYIKKNNKNIQNNENNEQISINKKYYEKKLNDILNILKDVNNKIEPAISIYDTAYSKYELSNLFKKRKEIFEFIQYINVTYGIIISGGGKVQNTKLKLLIQHITTHLS